MLDRSTVDSLFPSDLPDPSYWEQQYPPRQLPAGAKVTRFGPSPTGFLHIGAIYTASIDADVAHSSDGVYLVRIEDTDQSREVAGAIAQFERAFEYFGISSDESDANGAYGPYQQSERSRIYLTYVRELLRQGKAYLCFATREELLEITTSQQAAKLPTGYYGRWAIWRDAPVEEVQKRLAAGDPYVVRFRTPDNQPPRVRFSDVIRGELEHENNRNDAVILKSSDQELRLPTYHFAHVVDEQLMRINLVIRGEEWISSVPLHLQLFEALGFSVPEYAHVAPLMKQDGKARRKLSKRKDPEASVDFYFDAGYPIETILYYLRGLINGRLAEMPIAEALRTPIQLADCGVAGPLVDLVKLENISGDYIATLPGETIRSEVIAWAQDRDAELAEVLAAEPDLAMRAIAVEREGVDNPRKDLRKWSDFRPEYGFFFPQLFDLVTNPADERLGGLDPALVQAFASDLASTYQDMDDSQEWFGQIRELAVRHGFAPNPKEYKKNPDTYPGSIREAAQTIRVALTGSTRSPDLFEVAQVIGPDEVCRRVRALAG